MSKIDVSTDRPQGAESDHLRDATKMVATISSTETVKPVAYSYTDAKGRTVLVSTNTAPYEDAKPLYTAPPKREPLTDCGEAGHDEGRCGNANCITPPKREPLTDEEISKIFIYCGRDKETFARAIERAHGIGGDK